MVAWIFGLCTWQRTKTKVQRTPDHSPLTIHNSPPAPLSVVRGPLYKTDTMAHATDHEPRTTDPLDKSERRIRTMFGEISPRYDFLNHVLSCGVDYYWRRRTVQAAPLQDDGPILDVCTGTGDLAIAFWKRSRGRACVVGSDFTHEMLQLAGSKSARIHKTAHGGAPLVYVEADTQRLPFADDRFQIVSVAFGLRNVTNTELGLREMVRVCRPGGRVLILEFSMPRRRVLRGLYGWYFRRVLPKIGQLLARNRHSAYNYLPESVSAFPEGEDLAEIMRRCGLERVTWKPLTFGVATLYQGEKRCPISSSP